MTPPYVPPPSTASDEIGEALRNMEGKLKSMRGLLVANLVLVLALFALFQHEGEEGQRQTHDRHQVAQHLEDFVEAHAGQ